VSFPQSILEPNDSPQIVLDLKYCDETVQRSKHQEKRNEIIANNVQPPRLVPVLTMHQVDIRLKFDAIGRRPEKLTKKQKVIQEHILEQETGFTDLFEDEISLQDEIQEQMITTGLVPGYPPPGHEDKMLLLDSPSDSSQEGSDEDLFVEEISRLAKKRRNSSASVPTHRRDRHEALKLFDAALRTMICGNRAKLSAEIARVTVAAGPTLADISPTLFSPGYRQV